MICIDLPRPETIAMYCTRAAQATPERSGKQRKYTSGQRLEVIDRLRNGMGPEQASRYFHVPRATLSKWCRAAGIKFARGNYRTAKLIAS